MADWMSKAVTHPGASTRAAKAAGMSVHAWAEAHRNDGGTIGRRARLALTFEGMSGSKGGSRLAKGAASK